jgi:nitroreductase
METTPTAGQQEHLKLAPTPPGVIGPIRGRWSPRAFAERGVTTAELHLILEAGRWAQSCFNEQPWRFIIAMRNDQTAFARLLSVLAEKNQTWAKHAPVLGLTVARKTFTHNAKPNRHGMHDTGAALQNMAIQATAMGLHLHGMAGFDADKARALFAIPDEYEPATAFALGYLGDAAQLPEDFRKMELSARTRKPLEELVFKATTWGDPAALGEE